ncbi:hypothetical protein [Mechercharimyces sp. CAU 1602]|uniref:hypothetical protein n=1 Tax=Mechercharimyces sp. CAU 1602 TaxID=2973933 RepID=UPI0021633037|nr:hypothetical protein [Mechercharimyces sp. CAU 1602]MCS1351137.1 hypothetical protein [Mechercharimyces sp. CAU 1602]
MDKLKSRKLWMAILAALYPIVSEVVGIQLDEETYLGFTGAVVAYILGQSFVDGKQADKKHR